MRSKHFILFSILLFPVLAFGQSYTYDGAGNRTGRDETMTYGNVGKRDREGSSRSGDQ